MWETALVIVIALSVGFLTARSLYRTISGKDEGCAGGCAQCQCKKDS